MRRLSNHLMTSLMRIIEITNLLVVKITLSPIVTIINETVNVSTAFGKQLFSILAFQTHDSQFRTLLAYQTAAVLLRYNSNSR